jgi:hypothetical protein
MLKCEISPYSQERPAAMKRRLFVGAGCASILGFAKLHEIGANLPPEERAVPLIDGKWGQITPEFTPTPAFTPTPEAPLAPEATPVPNSEGRLHRQVREAQELIALIQPVLDYIPHIEHNAQIIRVARGEAATSRIWNDIVAQRYHMDALVRGIMPTLEKTGHRISPPELVSCNHLFVTLGRSKQPGQTDEQMIAKALEPPASDRDAVFKSTQIFGSITALRARLTLFKQEFESAITTAQAQYAYAHE